jgi:hypothetical protein
MMVCHWLSVNITESSSRIPEPSEIIFKYLQRVSNFSFKVAIIYVVSSKQMLSDPSPLLLFHLHISKHAKK